MEAVDELKNNRKGAVLMANEKNITTVRDEDKSFIRVIMSLPPEKKNLIQGIIIGLDLQEKQTATAAR